MRTAMYNLDEVYTILEGNARRGAEFLDEVLPGWAEHIDVYTLNMHHNNDCILGQLYGSFADGAIFVVNSRGKDTAALGFECDELSDEVRFKSNLNLTTPELYNILQSCWECELDERILDAS